MPRISRRKLLHFASLSPLVALVASGASSAEIAAAARALTNIPDPSSPVHGKAKAHDPNLPEDLFRQVVWVLWLNFVAGTKLHPEGIKDEQGIIEAAYMMQTNDNPAKNSGDKIVDNLDKWRDPADPSGKGRKTNWCAYKVGLEAAANATGRPIEVTDFQEAWGRVALVVKKTFDQPQNNKEATKEKRDDTEAFRGVGC
jgi:hypothetical protein